MFQKFYTDTLMTKFIKQLLATTETPLLSFIKNGDRMFKDCLYLYQHFVIKCCEAGIFEIDQEEFLLLPEIPPNQSNKIPVRTNIYPKNSQTGVAKFIVVHHFDPNNMFGFSSRYKSGVSWYDGTTHRYLGEYLRYIRDYNGIDLMKFYNCYDSSEVSGVHLTVPMLTEVYPLEYRYPSDGLYPGSLELVSSNSSGKSYELKNNSLYRVLSVPIKFGETYTIAIDCPTAISLRSVIYTEGKMLKIDATEEDTYYSDWLEETYVLRTASYFNQPFTYRAEIPSSLNDDQCKLLHDRENDLKLLIQVPIHNNSSVVVLEGNYVDQKEKSYTPNSTLSLLKFNTHESYAFSDRLIEYLLDNVITSTDKISDNIKHVQRSLINSGSSYAKNDLGTLHSLGTWDSGISTSVQELVKDSGGLWDQDGNINKDVEIILSQIGGYRA